MSIKEFFINKKIIEQQAEIDELKKNNNRLMEKIALEVFANRRNLDRVFEACRICRDEKNKDKIPAEIYRFIFYMQEDIKSSIADFEQLLNTRTLENIPKSNDNIKIPKIQ